MSKISEYAYGGAAQDTDEFVIARAGDNKKLTWAVIKSTLKTYFDTLYNNVPTGTMLPYGGASAPSGYLLANGSAVNRTTYAALFAVIGTTFGSGDGSTTFNLPDPLGRAIMGAGAGSGLTSRALGVKVGEETHALTSAENGPHTHTYNNYPGVQNTDTGAQTAAFTTAVVTNTSSSGSGTAHNNMQPSIAMNMIIKT